MFYFPSKVFYFLHSFADILQLGLTIDDDGEVTVPGISLRELDEGICHGDHPLVHRVHTALLRFLARASLTHSSDTSETEVDGADLSEFTRLDADLSRQLLVATSMHGAWPELLRRVAIALGSTDMETLKALHFCEYQSIGVRARARLLSLLCDGALGTVAARRAIDARMARLEGQSWDWEAAAWAGLVQRQGLHQLPRPEAVGRDRDHAVYWFVPTEMVVKQSFLRTQESDMRGINAVRSYGSHFEIFSGDATLRALHAALDTRGARESAMSTSLGNFINHSLRKAETTRVMGGQVGASGCRSRPDALLEPSSLLWPPLFKELLQATHPCLICSRRIKVKLALTFPRSAR